MIIVFKPHTPDEKIDEVSALIEKLGYEPRIIRGVEHTVIGAVGDENMHRSLDLLKGFAFVEDVLPIQKRYKLASREYNAEDSIVELGGVPVGGGNFAIVAGPCAVESREQMQAVAKDLRDCEIRILRGGAYKPRTSPYDFQGLGEEGLKILKEIKDEFGFSIVTEIVGAAHVAKVAKVADCLQIGARNCLNYNLLEAVADTGKPVLLKRGMAATIEEWLSAAEYLMVNGCRDVVLCERGIRTFETASRNTLDLGAVAIAKRETHLPVVVDPSHAAGRLDLVLPLAKAAIGVGADGLLLEVHPEPMLALSDAYQQIKSADFAEFLRELQPLLRAMGYLPDEKA